MENVKEVIDELSLVGVVPSEPLQQAMQEGFNLEIWLKKLRGGFLLVLGFLLSPLSFWNDLFFNLPIAYGFGYLCSLFNRDLLLPCAIAGYWLSNIIGILMMQVGAVDVFQEQSQQRNLKKDLFMGLVSSTVYSLLIVALVQLNILQAPDLFSGN